MSDTDTTTEGTKPAGGTPLVKKLILVLALVLGLAGGGALGFSLVGPMVGTRLTGGGGSGDHGGGHDGGHGGEVALQHVIENLVVNPAETEGTRFLLVSVALSPSPGTSADDLSARDVELRHALLRIFGSKTVSSLIDLEVRDTLLEEVREAVNGIVGEGAVAHVYFPQFVIQ